MSQLLTALFLALPLVIAGSLHMGVVRLDLFRLLEKPIHERTLGKNKTWRGLVVMPVAALIGVYVALPIEGASGDALLVSFRDASPVLLGLGLGAAYALFELPNSYGKRRLGIPPGELPERHRWLFAVTDQTDSVLGCVILYALLLRPPLPALALCLVVGPVIHLLANLTLYAFGLRKQPT